VEGQHAHTRVNPHGFEHEFGAFSSAPGVVESGAVSQFYSWFAGFAWQLVNCGGCHRHLGWLFRSESRTFYGLILNRIAEQQESEA